MKAAIARLDAARQSDVLTRARLPQSIRGYDHVKQRNLIAAQAEAAHVLDKFRDSPTPKETKGAA